MRRTVVITLAALLTLLSVGFVVFNWRNDAFWRAERKRLDATDQQSREQLVTAVANARERLQRLPTDMDELNASLGDSIEIAESREYPTSIWYYRKSDSHHRLRFIRFGVGKYTYNSDQSDAGWVNGSID